MLKIKLLFGLLIVFTLVNITEAQQKVYMTSGGEIIFSSGQLALNNQWVTENSTSTNTPTIVKHPVRFTLFLHVGQFVHFDINNTIGFFSGGGLRNIGVISSEVLPVAYGSDQYHDVKTVRRTYSLSVPLALKLGSFKKHFFVYGGGEIDWAFHFKEKYWTTNTRSGSKTKSKDWWPNQVSVLQPSAFVGVQFPGGVNLKVKYYLENFLNHDYSKRTSNTTAQVVSDLTKYKESRLFYFALSWHFNTSKITQSYKPDEEVAYLR